MTTLLSRYKIIKKIGGGTFGDTYLAEDIALPKNPPCLVKHLKRNPDFRVLAVALRFFEQEAQVLHELGKHDQIPSLAAHFQENGEFYLVQEFVDGHDLTKEIMPGRKLREQQAIKLLTEILEVLVIVHQQNIIHRDLKPSNIMRRRKDGKIVLIDFGAVKEIGAYTVNAQGQTSLTVGIGTPGYMPDEQANGRPKLASDIYAVGMIGIQAVTGLVPGQFQEDPNTGEIIWRNHAQISDRFATVLTKMVRDHFSQRYQNAMEALQALIPPAKTIVQLPPTAPHRDFLKTIVGLGVAIAISFSGVAVYVINDRDKRELEAKRYVGSMNRAQQFKYAEYGSLTNYVDGLTIGIKTETTNYKYFIESTKNAAFHYGIPKSQDLRGYVGGVFVVPDRDNTGKIEMTTVSILCVEATSGKSKMIPHPDLVQGSPTCAYGTEEVERGRRVPSYK
jgi:serine/threonine protein kinase